MIRTIRWLALELEGFGPWRDSVEFGFPERLCVLALPNERGKSTIVAGLAAVLYGLPADGLARWRSWGSDGPCRGRLDLSLDGRLIRFHRDIASHKTTVEEIANGEPRKVLFNDTANPSGRTSSKHGYAEVLRGILADLADEGLFRATFLVTQPVVPAGEISTALPRLISGVGRVSGEEARNILFEEVKRLTRATGELGISLIGKSPTNQRTDGAIERAEARIQELERVRDETSLEFARIASHDVAFREAQTALASAVEEDGHARADSSRLSAYRRDAASFEEARAARDELAESLRLHDGEIATLREIDASIDRDFPDLAGISVEIEGEIDEAISLESRIDAARADLVRFEHDLESRRRDLDTPRGWGELPGSPDPVAWVTRVRATAERWCDTFRKFQESTGEHLAAEEACRRFATVADLPAETQDALARLPEALAELDDRERIHAHDEEGHRLLVEGITRRRQAFERRWIALQGVESTRILPVLESRVARHRKLDEIEEQLAQIRSGVAGGPSGLRWKRGILTGIPVALAAAAVSIGLKAPTAIVVSAAVGLFALAVLILSRPQARSRDANIRLAAIEREAEQIRASLRMEFIPSGPWLPDDAGSYDRARAAFAERDEDEAALLQDQESLDRREEEGEAARLRADARERRERLERTAREVEKEIGMPAADAVRASRDALRRRDQILTRLAGTRAELLGIAEAPEGADDLSTMPIDSLGPTWRPLVEAGAILDLGAASIADLYPKLSALTQRQWDEWEALARRHVDSQISMAGAMAERDERNAKIREMEEAMAGPISRIGTGRIAASGGSFVALRSRLRLRTEAVQKRDIARRLAGEYLKTARGGPYPDRDALAGALTSAEDRRRDARHRMDAACEESDLLRAYERSAPDPPVQDRIRREVEARGEDAARRLDEAKGALARAQANLDAWRPPAPANIAAIEMEIARLRETTKALQRRRDACLRAWRILGDAVDEFRFQHRETLAEKIDTRFRAITRRPDRRIALNADLGIEVVEDSVSVPEDRLSQGARDQLAFSLRIAVAELIGGEEVVLPLILDDPFVHSDVERLERIHTALDDAARERQVILLTQDERLRDWGESVSISPRSR